MLIFTPGRARRTLQAAALLCAVPVHAQHRGRLFLPFADDDPKTAEVISKTLLLAKDHGLILVGPLPPEIQNYTSYTAVPMTAGTQKHVARAFVTFLSGPVGKLLFVSAGIE